MIKSVEEKCFSVIDKHASHVLESDEFEDISLELLKHIITRDSLQIQSGETSIMMRFKPLITFYGIYIYFFQS